MAQIPDFFKKSGISTSRGVAIALVTTATSIAAIEVALVTTATSIAAMAIALVIAVATNVRTKVSTSANKGLKPLVLR